MAISSGVMRRDSFNHFISPLWIQSTRPQFTTFKPVRSDQVYIKTTPRCEQPSCSLESVQDLPLVTEVVGLLFICRTLFRKSRASPIIDCPSISWFAAFCIPFAVLALVSTPLYVHNNPIAYCAAGLYCRFNITTIASV